MFKRYLTWHLQDEEKSPAEELRARCASINDWHTYETYAYACRGLFERHKLLLAFQICVRRLAAEGKTNTSCYNADVRAVHTRRIHLQEAVIPGSSSRGKAAWVAPRVLLVHLVAALGPADAIKLQVTIS